MLGDLENSLAVAGAMLEEAGPGRVGFKLRLGLDDARTVLPDLALRLEDLGAGWLTLHPRTARQGFGGTADWEALARLKPRLSLPLLASGDLFNAADGLRCLEQTGATGVMYARGAMHGPGIFAAHLALWPGEAHCRAHARRPAGHDFAAHGPGALTLPRKGRAVENALQWCRATCGPCPARGPCAGSSAAVLIGGSSRTRWKIFWPPPPADLPFRQPPLKEIGI